MIWLGEELNRIRDELKDVRAFIDKKRLKEKAKKEEKVDIRVERGKIRVIK